MASKDKSFDIIDLLLSNENKGKKDVGVAKTAPIDEVPVIEIDDEVEEAYTKNSRVKAKLQYISVEDYVKLGETATGYTTARIAKYERGSQDFYETLLEYYRAAIKYMKLTKVIGWYEETNVKKLDLCRQEIAEFRKVNNITNGDLGRIIQLIHYYEGDRKSLIKKTNEIAGMVLPFRKMKDGKATLANVANIPSNARPTLKYVKETVIDEEESVEDILKDALKVNHGCSTHENYKGLRIPRNGCDSCMSLYEYNKKHGIKEERNERD